MERVLVAAAHPDDEILGCGGTIALHAAQGAAVHVLILGEGMTSRGHSRPAGLQAGDLEGLRRSAREAASVLGVQNTLFHDFPDNRFDTVPLLEIVKVIEKVVADVRPTTVYTHHPGDLNVDHGRTCAAVLAACRPLPGASVRCLYAFEVPSSTEWTGPVGDPFQPTLFVDIGRTLDLKLRAMACYQTELRDWPHPRSLKAIEHLARWRGATAGREAAEAFAVLREVR